MTGTLNGTSEAISLEDFAAARKPRRWADSLPAEIVAEIKASDAPVAAVLAWLETIGVEGATKNKVTELVRSLRA